MWAGEETNQVVTVAGCLSVISRLFLSSYDIIELTGDKAFVSFSLPVRSVKRLALLSATHFAISVSASTDL